MLLSPKSINLANLQLCSFSRAKLAFLRGLVKVLGKMTHFSSIKTLNFCHICFALTPIVLFRFLCLFFLGLVLRVIFFLAFLVGTIRRFVSNLSIVATSSFELFFLPLLLSRASKQYIVVFFFLQAFDTLHGQIFVFQKLLNFGHIAGSTSWSLLNN